jgi:ATP adenylyltransferase
MMGSVPSMTSLAGKDHSVDYFFNFQKMEYLRGKRPLGCILCLVRDESPEAVDMSVHRAESFIVSVNLYPYNPGHLLIFPKRHVSDIRDLSRDERLEMDGLIDLTLSVLDSTHHAQGYNIGFNMGLPAGASIDHLHLHIIPRYQREIGIAELVSGMRVLVEDPRETRRIVKEAFDRIPDSPQASPGMAGL